MGSANRKTSFASIIYFGLPYLGTYAPKLLIPVTEVVLFYCGRRQPVKRKRRRKPPDKPGNIPGLQVVHGVPLGITVTLDYTVVDIVHIAATFVDASLYCIYMWSPGYTLITVYFLSFISTGFPAIHVPYQKKNQQKTFGLSHT